MNWFKKTLASPLPKIVICFQQNGCMATELEFQWIGTVAGTYVSEGGTTVYQIQPLIKGSSENRNYKDKPLPIQEAWQLQHLGLNLYIHYT